MPPVIGVVGALCILKGATCVYESLFGRIQPPHEQDSKEEQAPQEKSTGLAEVTESNGPIQEVSQARLAEATTNDQRACQTEGQPKKESVKNKQSVSLTSSKIQPKNEVQGLTSEAKEGGKMLQSKKHTCDNAKKNALAKTVQQVALQTKGQPQKESARNKLGTPSSLNQIQPKNVVQGLTSEAKKGGKGLQPKKHTQYNVNKNAPTTTKQQVASQNKKGSAQGKLGVPSTSRKILSKNEVQGLTSEAQKGGKVIQPKKHNCDNAKKNPQTTTKQQVASQTKGQPKKGSAQNKLGVPSISSQIQPRNEVQGLTSETQKGGKVIQPKKHTRDNAKKNPQTTTKQQVASQTKGQPKKRSAQNKQGVPSTSSQIQPTNEVQGLTAKKRGKVVQPKKHTCGNAEKNAVTSSSKDQTKKQTTQKDHGSSSEVKKLVPKDQGQLSKLECANTECREKEPEKFACGSAKKIVATTLHNQQFNRYSILQDQITTCEANVGKKGTKVKEPTTTLSCDDTKKTVPTKANKKQQKRQQANKDQGPTRDADASQNGGKDPKKATAGRTGPTASTKRYSKEQPSKPEKDPLCSTHAAVDGDNREETEVPFCGNPEKCVPTMSDAGQLRKGQGQCEATAVKNQGKGNKTKKQSSNNMKSMDGLAASNRLQLQEVLAQKQQSPVCQVDGGKKASKPEEGNSGSKKEMTTSVTPAQYLANLKKRESICLPENSKEMPDKSIDVVKDSDSEWILVEKHNKTKNKDMKKTGRSEECSGSQKKTSASGIAVEKEIQPKPSAEPALSKSGCKDRKAEEPPKRKRPTRRAKKKPQKGKAKPNDTSAKKEEDSLASPQQGHNSANIPVAPSEVVNTWANIVKSKSNADTPSLHNQNTTKESCSGKKEGGETQKNAELEESVSEISWNVPVMYKKCIGRKKKKATCVEQKATKTTSVIAEPLKTSSDSVTTTNMQDMQQPSQVDSSKPTEVKYSVTHETEKPLPDLLAEQDVLHVLGLSIPNFPIKLEDVREEEVQDSSAKCDDTKLSTLLDENCIIAPSMTNLAEERKSKDGTTSVTTLTTTSTQAGELATLSRIIPALLEPSKDKRCMEQATGPEVQLFNPTHPGGHALEEEVLQVLGLSIPNFPVKLEDEREEEVQDSSAKCDDTKLSMMHDENCIIAPSMTNLAEERKSKDGTTSVTTLTTTSTQAGELATLSRIIPAVSEPSKGQRCMERETDQEVQSFNPTHSGNHALQQDVLHVLGLSIPNFPVKLVEEREEEVQDSSVKCDNSKLSTIHDENCIIAPSVTNLAEEKKSKDGTIRATTLTTTSTQAGELATPSRIITAVSEPFKEQGCMERATDQEVQTLNPTHSSKHALQQDVLHVLGLSIPNFPVKLVEEREEEVQDSSAEWDDTKLSMRHDENCIIALSVTDPLEERKSKDGTTSITAFTTTSTQAGELAASSRVTPAMSEPLKQQGCTEKAIGKTLLTSTATHTDKHALQQEELHVLGMSIPNFPVKLEDEGEEEVQDLSTNCEDTKLSTTCDENCIIAPSMTNLLEERKSKDGTTSVTILTTTSTLAGQRAITSQIVPALPEPLEQSTCTKVLISTSTQTDEQALQGLKTLLTFASVKPQSTDDKPIVNAEVQKSNTETSTQDGPSTKPPKLSALSPSFIPCNTSSAVNTRATMMKYREGPATQRVSSYDQGLPSDHMQIAEVERPLPVRYVQGVPTTNLPHMSALNPAYSLYPFTPAMQQLGNIPFSVSQPAPLLSQVEDPSALQYGTTYYQNYNYLAPSTGTWQMGYQSTPYNACPTYVPVHQRPILSPMHESYVQTTYPIASLEVASTRPTKAAVPSPTSIIKTLPLQAKRQQQTTTFVVKQPVQIQPQVTYSNVVPTTSAPLDMSPPSANKTTKAKLPLKQQQTDTTSAKKKTMQKPPPATSSELVPTTSEPLDRATPSATKTPKAKTPLEQLTTDTTSVVKKVAQKPAKVPSLKVVPTTSAPLEIASSSATKTPKAEVLLQQQQTDTKTANKQVMQKPATGTSSKVVPISSMPLDTALPSAVKTPDSEVLRQQKTGTKTANKLAVQKPLKGTSSEVVSTTSVPLDRTSPSAIKTPNSEAPLKEQQTDTKHANKQAVHKPALGITSKVVPSTCVPLDLASPTSIETPKAEVQLQQQQTDTRTAEKQNVQKPIQVTNSKIVPTTSAPLDRASPSATKTSKTQSPLEQQQTDTTSVVKKVAQKPAEMPSSKVVPTTSTPRIASLSATKTSKVEAPLKQPQTNSTSVVTQVVQKPVQVTSSKVLSISSALLDITSTSATKTSKVEEPLKQALTNSTSVVKQVVQKPVQVKSSNVVPTASAPLELASLSATKTGNTSSQAVRPKERGSNAISSSSKHVATPATNETASTATSPKMNRSARRRRARARQRARKRAEEAEPRVEEWRAPNAERNGASEATSEGATALVEETKEADSSNHQGEVASSSSSEIILDFDDDSEFVIDWEAEAAKPFYNSTEIFPPRVDIPEWAQWDFSQNERLQQLGQENHFK